MNEALARLRAAIVVTCTEDGGELMDDHEELVDAFNTIPGVDPITPEEYGADEEED